MSIGTAIAAALGWELLDALIDRAATPPEKPKPGQWCQKRDGKNNGFWRRPRTGQRRVRR